MGNIMGWEILCIYTRSRTYIYMQDIHVAIIILQLTVRNINIVGKRV